MKTNKINKKIIVTEQQLNEYVKRKKAENTFNLIIEYLFINSKYLNENISKKKANKSIVENFEKKGLINDEVKRLLKEYNIIDD